MRRSARADRLLRKHGILPHEAIRPHPEKVVHGLRRKQDIVNSYVLTALEWLRKTSREGQASGYNSTTSTYALLQGRMNINNALDELGWKK